MLNSTISVLLRGRLGYYITRGSWYAIKKVAKTVTFLCSNIFPLSSKMLIFLKWFTFILFYFLVCTDIFSKIEYSLLVKLTLQAISRGLKWYPSERTTIPPSAPEQMHGYNIRVTKGRDKSNHFNLLFRSEKNQPNQNKYLNRFTCFCFFNYWISI